VAHASSTRQSPLDFGAPAGVWRDFKVFSESPVLQYTILLQAASDAIVQIASRDSVLRNFCARIPLVYIQNVDG
jgi:hypothetical protein